MIHQRLRRTFLRLAATTSVAVAMLSCMIAAGQPARAVGRSIDPGLELMGHRFLTFSTLVRVRQIETTREEADGPDESSVHTPAEARVFRDAVEKGWPGARITWGFSWLALKDQRPNYMGLKKLVVSYHEKYGDEITFVPGGYFANMYNTREQVNRDLHDGLQMVSAMVGGGYRPQCVIAGFLAAENLRFLAGKEGIHVCQGNIWSQYAVDNGDGEGSICYPYYPSREHFCKPAQGSEDLIDCVNLDGWTVDFLCARYAASRMIHGIRCGSRQGVGPIETLLRMGTEQGTKAMLATTAAHFDKGFELNNFAWVTSIWELCLVEGRKIYGYKGRNGIDGLVIWLSEIRRRWPEAKCITHGEFGMLWREHFKNNDNLNYRFVQRGSGIGGSDAEMEIRWFMNKDFRLALLRNWQDNSPEKLIDFTRYDLTAREPADPTPGQHSRNWSLLNRLNQKGVRAQDQPISITELNTDEQALIKGRCPDLITDDGKPLLHPMFADHAVLQRDAKVPVWGWAAPGTRLTVSFAGQETNAIAGTDGKWMLFLDPMAACADSRTLKVQSNISDLNCEISDVLVGDVWLCSGQSNMEMGIGMCKVSNEIAAADFPRIRLLTVPKKIAYAPELTLQCAWLPCNPTTVTQGGWGGFSAAGYFFGRDLHRELDIPVGLIETCWGGTVCEAWTSREALAPLGEFKSGLAQVEQVASGPGPNKLCVAMDKWYQAQDPGTSKEWFKTETDVSSWKAVNMPGDWNACGLPGYEGVVWAQRTFEAPAAWADRELVLSFGTIGDVDTTWVNGIVVGRTDYFDQPRTYRVPEAVVKTGRNVIAMRVVNSGGGGFFGTAKQMKVYPSGEEGSAISLAGPWRIRDSATRTSTGAALAGNPNICTVLYNGMIAPLIPFAIKGAVWYQGESNAERAYQYRALLQTMIQDWRSRFGVGDFGFHIVSLANYKQVCAEPRDNDWAELREAQAMAAKSLPNCGIAMAIDIGDANDIHPRNKAEVGRRLALSALAITYGKKIEWSGPWYKSMEITGQGIRLTFDHAQSGLVAKGDRLTGFAIAGEDRKFVWADAVIEGKTVLVSSPAVPKPAAVRYGWDANPACNLFNKENLPAVPFRTDHWPGVTQKQ